MTLKYSSFLLKTHLSQVHRVERLYKCFECHKSFNERRNLKVSSSTCSTTQHTEKFCLIFKRHMYTHIDVCLFSCNKCDKWFKTDDQLKVSPRFFFLRFREIFVNFVLSCSIIPVYTAPNGHIPAMNVAKNSKETEVCG